MAELTKLASAKKIAPGDFHEISRTLKKVKSAIVFSPASSYLLTPCDIVIILMFSYCLLKFVLFSFLKLI